MASGTMSLSVIASGYGVRIRWSVSSIPSGRRAIIDVIDTARTYYKRIDLGGSGSYSGTYDLTGLQKNTEYRFGLYDYKSQSDYNLLSMKYITTSYTPPPPSPSGTLSGQSTGPTTASLNYSYKNGTNVSLFRGSDLLQTFGSGSGSGVYNDSGLDAETQYTYYLRNGTTTGSTKLAQTTINTPELPAEGTLSKQVIDSNTINLTYSFHDGENVSLFRGSSKVTTFGSGSGSGTYRDTGLAPDTEYTYYLRNGTSTEDYLLAQVTGKTLEEVRKSIIKRGKILPMKSQLTVFDDTVTPLGLIEDFQYLYWHFKYRNFGNFKLVINRYKPNVEYLEKGNILAIYVAGYYRAGIIESKEIELTEEGKISENYTIIGRGLGGLLAERKAEYGVSAGTGYDSQDTVASTAMRHYVNVNCMISANEDKNYPLLYLEDPDPVAGGNIKYDARFQYLNELCEEISLAAGIGWEVVLDPTNKRFVFRIIEGLDRSFGNGVNTPVTFSPEFENIKLLNYLDSNINSKNVATVAGQGEGADRLIVEVTKDGGTYAGMDRREIFIDARDLDSEAKLIQRGNERLVELGETKSIFMENLSTGRFKFGEDFYLGDIVTVEYPDIVSGNIRVVESIIEIDAENLIQNKLVLGKSFPDLITISEYKNKNITPEIRR